MQQVVFSPFTYVCTFPGQIESYYSHALFLATTGSKLDIPIDNNYTRISSMSLCMAFKVGMQY